MEVTGSKSKSITRITPNKATRVKLTLWLTNGLLM